MPSQHRLSLKSSSGENEPFVEDGKFLWSNMLKEVTLKTSFKLPSTRALVVLGDDESGKTTVIARLQGTEDPKKSFGLEYTFIDIKDEDRDDQTKLNVWILDGDVNPSRLLKFALNANNFGECVVVIVVSMAEPWNILESLEKWASLLRSHIDCIDIPPETLSEYKDELVCQFRDYVEPDGLLPPSNPAPVTHPTLVTAPTVNARRLPTHGLHPAVASTLSSVLTNSMPKADEPKESQVAPPTVLPLDATTLSDNLGIPIVVVVTKTDTMNMLEKEKRFTEEHFDFIQMHIRRFCLKYGAALFYVSVKEDKHCDLLGRYLQSRIYGFPFTQAPYVVERDRVFVPAGWDSEKKIAIIEENFTQIRSGDPYNDVIPRPQPLKAVREPELAAQDEQTFLGRMIAVMQREIAAAGLGASAASTDAILDQAVPQSGGSPAMAHRTGSPRTPSSGPRSKPSPPTSGPTSAGATSGTASNARGPEGLLANFFTSLLNKRPNVAGSVPSMPSPPTSGSDKLNMSPKDIQSELERLARTSREALDASKPSKPKSAEQSMEVEQTAAEVETTTTANQ